MAHKITRKTFLKTIGGAVASAAVATSPLSVFAEKQDAAAGATPKHTGKSGKLLAGIARKKITPSPEQLEAYRKLDPRLSGGIAQEIYARIIVLGNDFGDKLLLLSADLHSLPFYGDLADAVSRKYGIPKSACIMSGTLNRQAVALESRDPAVAVISKGMIDTILAGVGEAIASMQPAKMALDMGTSNINAHFGRTTPIGVVHMPDFSKFADKQLSVLRIDDLTGKTLALYVNYGMQSNMMDAASKKLSGDLAGHIGEYMERRLGCMCAFTAGAAAEAYPLAIATVNNPIFEANGKGRLETSTLSEEAAGRLRDYLTSVQALDILAIHSRMTRFSEVFAVRCDEQEYSAAGKKAPVTHRLHLAVVNQDIALAGANSIASARLGKLVKDALPYRTIFLSCEGASVGYIVDRETNPKGIAGLSCPAADAAESETIYVRGFSNLAKTMQS